MLNQRAKNMDVTVVQSPPFDRRNDHYNSNRAPLMPNPLGKLPLGSIRAFGWLKHQLDLMADGMHGRLEELSSYLKPDSGWFGTKKQGWEEQPYWLRGFYPLSILTNNERCLASSKKWIEAVLTSQDVDGYFGAPYHKTITGKTGRSFPDLWPHMIMLDVVIQHHEYTNDDRVVPFVKAFFEFCRNLPDDQFLPTFVWTDSERYAEEFGDSKTKIQHTRAGDMIPHIYWLYNRTGDSWLLDLATRFFEHIKPEPDEWLDHHIVNFTQRFQYPGVYYALSGNARHLALTEYWYAQHMGTWGQQPRGIFAADELIWPGKVDPRQGFETCGLVEFAKSFYLLGRTTGNPLYADRTEDIMLNQYPPSHTPDLKALHYLTASNQPQLDCSGQHDYYNKGHQIDYSPHLYRCCQHNAAMGWPWYVQNLWQTSSDNGLATWLYSASEVSAVVGDGTKVVLHSKTDYPFNTNVDITIKTSGNCAFPLYLRVPRWCSRFTPRVNGKALDVQPETGSFVRIERTWSDGDVINIDMPVEVSMTTWPRNGSVTVDRGPLSYSLRIKEKWKRCGGNNKWPEWEVLAKTPWNYGLVINDNSPIINAVNVKSVGLQPWTVESAPIELKANAKRIPGWKIGNDQTVEKLPQSPVNSGKQEKEITLIPMGCARLRITSFPVVGE